MKLYELIDLIDYNRESEAEILQIIRPDSDYDVYDSILTSSALLVPLYDAEVKSIGAIGEDIIRIEIDWKKLDEEIGIFKWGTEK